MSQAWLQLLADTIFLPMILAGLASFLYRPGQALEIPAITYQIGLWVGQLGWLLYILSLIFLWILFPFIHPLTWWRRVNVRSSAWDGISLLSQPNI